MRIGHYIRRALSLPPQVACRKAIRKVQLEWQAWSQYRQESRHPTYRTDCRFESDTLHNYLSGLMLDPTMLRSTHIAWLSRQYVRHRFDLLGSGWVTVRQGMSCLGMEGNRYDMGHAPSIDPQGEWLKQRINVANLDEARGIWRLIDEEYTPLDWQLDFKSGYRWSERTWYRRVPLVHLGHLPGVDVKVPWELARMQHLPQLALAYGLAKSGAAGVMPSDRYVREFRNQVLDFMATNPPRYGVNWTCSMDVAIRAANWLIAYDLFRSLGATFDREFGRLFVRSLYEHGTHLIHNLEWSSEAVGNHYLANVVGLLFIAAYLPSDADIDTWLAFAVQELLKEAARQFLADGANFEASTSYHGLCAEMVAYGTAVVLGLAPEKRRALMSYDPRRHRVQPELEPPPIGLDADPEAEASPFPSWYWDRLRLMGEFISDLTRPDGRIPQFGDCDNGRFVKLAPVLDLEEGMKVRSESDPDGEPVYREKHGDHREVRAALAALVGESGQTDDRISRSLNFVIVSGLARHKTRAAPSGRLAVESAAETVRIADGKATASALSRSHEAVDAPSGAGLGQGKRLFGYPEFGLYLYKSSRLYLAIRCGRGDRNRIGNHAHNDNLSFELAWDGVLVVVDPGTYVYTASLDQRNLYRSTAMHNTLVLGGREQNEWQPGREGLFLLRDQSRAKVEEFREDCFAGVHEGFGVPHRRRMTIGEDSVIGLDECPSMDAKRVLFHLSPDIRATLTEGRARLHLRESGTVLELQSDTGEVTLADYWYSDSYGHREPAQVLAVSVAGVQSEWCIRVVGGQEEAR
ncbi:MAG TPA: alginate lyase family protein [Nitrospiraceae bacterium]|nr:alginate lyase family protein [Nitrospiraceae bacterium]